MSVRQHAEEIGGRRAAAGSARPVGAKVHARVPRRFPLSYGLGSRLVLLVLALGVFVAGPAESATRFRIRYRTRKGTKYLYMRDIARYYGMAYEVRGHRVTFRSKYSTLTFTVDRRQARINGVRVHLSDVPWKYKGEVLLANHDFRLLLDPILRSKVLQRGSVKRILIDPGHGGRDPGAMGKHCCEKTITLAVSKKVAAALRARGYTVVLTHTGDTSMSLAQRVAKIKSWKPDIVISIHCNSVGTNSVAGVEVFRATPKGARGTYTGRRTTTACRNNAWDLDNVRLAYEIQKRVVSTCQATDRGIKNARFLVLRESPCPAVLIEMGYLTNACEECKLGSATYQSTLVRGIVDGIRFYAGSLTKKP